MREACSRTIVVLLSTLLVNNLSMNTSIGLVMPCVCDSREMALFVTAIALLCVCRIPLLNCLYVVCFASFNIGEGSASAMEHSFHPLVSMEACVVHVERFAWNARSELQAITAYIM